MPTRPTKGDHGTSDRGSRGRGAQKATYGSAVSEDVADGRAEVDDARGRAAHDEDEARDSRPRHDEQRDA